MQEFTDEEKQILRQDEENEQAFESFLQEINREYKDYFASRTDNRKDISFFFGLLQSGRPPAIRLRYIQPSKLDEEIKHKVISKYKEIFGKYADYQIIER